MLILKIEFSVNESSASLSLMRECCTIISEACILIVCIKVVCRSVAYIANVFACIV